MIEKEYQRKGVALKKEKIRKNLLEKAAADFIQKTKAKEQEDMVSKKTERLAHFEKNYKKK